MGVYKEEDLMFRQLAEKQPKNGFNLSADKTELEMLRNWMKWMEDRRVTKFRDETTAKDVFFIAWDSEFERNVGTDYIITTTKVNETKFVKLSIGQKIRSKNCWRDYASSDSFKAFGTMRKYESGKNYGYWE